MGDFERKLREAKAAQELEGVRKKQAEEERKRHLENLAPQENPFIKQRREKYVLPIKPMVEKLVGDLASANWQNSGLTFDEPFHQEMIARWTIQQHNLPQKFCIVLRKEGDHLFFTSGIDQQGQAPRDQTDDTSEEELRDLLTREHLRGPQVPFVRPLREVGG